MKRIAILVSLLLVAGLAFAADGMFPGPGWKEKPNPLAGAHAQRGGQMASFLGPSPKSLNYYLESSSLASEVFGLMYESLLGMDPVTLEYIPGLAAKWSISADKRTYAFYMDKKAKWSDGRPVTAKDVKFTFDAILDPKNMTGSHKVALARFSSPVVVNASTIRFTAKEVHWKNLLALGGFQILPAHAWAGQDFNKVNFSFPVVSGPFKMGAYKQGVSLTMLRRNDWWSAASPGAKGTYNFDRLHFLFYEERENAFEAFKKGAFDLYPIYTSRMWVKETTGEKFQKNLIVKQRVHNHNPVGFQGFAMNMRRAPFNDLRVRKAMALLLDRPKMNATIMYNQYFLQNSYYQDLYSPPSSCPNPQTPFDKNAARKLLAQAGWKADPKTGILMKAGKPFRFQFLSRDASSGKFLSIYQQDLKDVGISMEIVVKDWAAWMKDMENYSFEMTWAAWGAGLFKDPETMWSSKEAARTAGDNITGFADKAVDQLIEKQKTLFSVAARHDICRKIDKLVFAQYPYALLWNIDYVRLLYWNRLATPDWVLSKYGDESSANALWWIDPDDQAAFDDALRKGTSLPARPGAVVFSKVFRQRAQLVPARIQPLT
ncbi:MAG: ABC transporter substrate-binding protein [Deltaproteobacteria bacterium]|nr:ABC transporter substrate-binding protein [Deltaproteobacteria bacterium]